jgi:chloramphenicol O-acetyltransferase type A
MHMTFTKLDPTKWPRMPYFYYFTKMAPTSFSITQMLDITVMHARTHTLNLRLFPAYLYAASRVIAEMPELRLARVDDQLGHYDLLHPNYTLIRGDHSMLTCWTHYTPNFTTFYRQFLTDEAAALQINAGPVGKAAAPANSFQCGMLPWSHFTSYTPLPQNGLASFAPVLQAGRYVDGQMPLSVTVNHAVADGYHVGQFFDRMQKLLNNPNWL